MCWNWTDISVIMFAIFKIFLIEAGKFWDKKVYKKSTRKNYILFLNSPPKTKILYDAFVFSS